jgi:putative tryptophan/tyrosine transport system substrate-binding protein
MDRERPDAILMVSDSLTLLNRRRVFEYAAERQLPAIYETDSLTREGGLMSYGPDRRETQMPFTEDQDMIQTVASGGRESSSRGLDS